MEHILLFRLNYERIYMESSLMNLHNNGVDVNSLLQGPSMSLKETKDGTKYFVKEEIQ